MSATGAPSLGERLKVHWLSQGLAVRPGVSMGAIQAFEARYRVRLPEDLCDYFTVVNGMGQCMEMDDNLFCFWTLEEMKPLNEEWPGESYFEEPEAFFLFADQSLRLPSYAIRLSPTLAEVNIIHAIYSDTRKHKAWRVANSFAQFVEEYFAHGIVL